MEEEKEQNVGVQIKDEVKETKKEIKIKRIDKGSNIVKGPTKIEEKKANKDIKKIRVAKSNNFVECRKLLLSERDALQKNDKNKAMKLYKKAKEVYAHLGYHEERKLYKEFMEFYNKFKVGKF